MKNFLHQMSYSSRSLLVTIILSFYYTHQCIRVFAFFEVYSCYISNYLPDNNSLDIHIFSGSDDLGIHNLTSHELFRWNFRMAIFYTTKFYGDFWWRSMDRLRDFAVFDKKKNSQGSFWSKVFQCLLVVCKKRWFLDCQQD